MFVADTFNNRIQKFTVTIPTTSRPDFALNAAPTSLTVVRGGSSAATTVTIQPGGGFDDPVTLTAAGVPPGVTVTPTPPVTVAPDTAGTYASTSLAFKAAAGAGTGSYAITITGAGGGAAHSTTLTVRVRRK